MGCRLQTPAAEGRWWCKGEQEAQSLGGTATINKKKLTDFLWTDVVVFQSVVLVLWRMARRHGTMP